MTRSAQAVAIAAALAMAACGQQQETGQGNAGPVEARPPAAATVGDGDASDASDLELVELSITQLLGDPAEYREVFDRLQAGVEADDREAVAALVDYPIEATIDGGQRLIGDQAEFVAAWSDIVTPDITRVITSQQYDKVFVNWQGVMLGDGQVWINGVCRDEGCAESDVRVTAIQPVDAAQASFDEFAFTVEVALSDAAERQLGESGETVVVGASFFGDPADGVAQELLNDVGQIDLGRKEVELSGSGRASFDRDALKLDLLDAITGPPQVNVNVWSGRRSSEDNRLDCDFFQDAIAVAAQGPVRLDCRLLPERGDGD